jgi:hypothetical protein
MEGDRRDEMEEEERREKKKVVVDAAVRLGFRGLGFYTISTMFGLFNLFIYNIQGDL